MSDQIVLAERDDVERVGEDERPELDVGPPPLQHAPVPPARGHVQHQQRHAIEDVVQGGEHNFPIRGVGRRRQQAREETVRVAELLSDAVGSAKIKPQV